MSGALARPAASDVAIPDHAQVTLADLRRRRDEARRQCEQLDYAIAGVCLAYGVGDAEDREAQQQGPRGITAAHVVGFKAEAKLRAQRKRAQRKRAAPLVATAVVVPATVTKDDVVVALAKSPPIGWSVGEVTRAAYPNLPRPDIARVADQVGHVLDALVADGRVVKDDRLYRHAPPPAAAS